MVEVSKARFQDELVRIQAQAVPAGSNPLDNTETSVEHDCILQVYRMDPLHPSKLRELAMYAV